LLPEQVYPFDPPQVPSLLTLLTDACLDGVEGFEGVEGEGDEGSFEDAIPEQVPKLALHLFEAAQ
jgi:hypothetical protein